MQFLFFVFFFIYTFTDYAYSVNRLGSIQFSSLFALFLHFVMLDVFKIHWIYLPLAFELQGNFLLRNYEWILCYACRIFPRFYWPHRLLSSLSIEANSRICLVYLSRRSTILIHRRAICGRLTLMRLSLIALVHFPRATVSLKRDSYEVFVPVLGSDLSLAYEPYTLLSPVLRRQLDMDPSWNRVHTCETKNITKI